MNVRPKTTFPPKVITGDPGTVQGSMKKRNSYIPVQLHSKKSTDDHNGAASALYSIDEAPPVEIDTFVCTATLEKDGEPNELSPNIFINTHLFHWSGKIFKILPLERFHKGYKITITFLYFKVPGLSQDLSGIVITLVYKCTIHVYCIHKIKVSDIRIS